MRLNLKVAMFAQADSCGVADSRPMIYYGFIRWIDVTGQCEASPDK